MPDRVPGTVATHVETLQFATFYVGGLLLAVPIQQVQEINQHLELTDVPNAPASVRGVINLRGEVVTVVDLSQRLGLAPTTIGETSRNMIVQHLDERIGLIVDDVADIMAVPQQQILPPPANIQGVDSRFFKGVYATDSQIVVLLDVAETLS